MVHIRSELIGKIDKIILQKTQNEPYGLLAGLGGCCLYFSSRFHQTNDPKFADHCFDILENIIDKLNKQAITSGHNISLGHPLVAPCWLVDQFVKSELLSLDEKDNSKFIVEQVLESLIQEDFDDNMHDLFSGFIGKAIILIENDPEANRNHIDRIVAALNVNAIKDDGDIYWNTRDPFYPSSRM